MIVVVSYYHFNYEPLVDKNNTPNSIIIETYYMLHNYEYFFFQLAIP